MFERDKNELRDLGIPLETGRVSASDPAEGYRINRDAYALPDIELTDEESGAVAIATQLWESPELITATQGALLKLRAAGVDVDPDAAVAITTASGRPDCVDRRTCWETCCRRSIPVSRSNFGTAPCPPIPTPCERWSRGSGHRQGAGNCWP